MKTLRFPLRLKIMVALLFGLTAVVIAITFTMANFFHEDKQSYMNDWTSIAVMSTAEESRSMLKGYARQLRMGALLMQDASLSKQERERLLQGVFDGFPELVEMTLYRDGKEIESARDAKSLEAASLTPADLAKERGEHPLPMKEIRAGNIYVANSTLKPSLPAFTMALAQDEAGDGPSVVIAAVVRLDALMRIGAKFRVFEVTLTAPDGTLLVHPDVRRVVRHDRVAPPPAAGGALAKNQAGTTLEYKRNGVDMIAGFAAVNVGGITAAAQMPKSAAYSASRDLLNRLSAVAVVFLLVVAVGGRLWARRITRPLERLSDATRQIARGSFDVKVDVRARDEIGALAGSFNQMASELNVREKALEDAHTQLLQSEKMSAFGQLGAGIAHEVKNPLAGILGCAQISMLDVDEGSMLHTNLKMIEKETQRCKTIIENLMKFARQEKALMEPTQINTVAEDAMAIVNHQLELNQVKLVKDLQQDLPLIHGNGNQLQQVLINLLVNAQQAMKGKPGTIEVKTCRREGDRVEVRVQDSGPGIPKDIQAKIFEPFFTTKPAGQGTGLGLSVSFGIVKDHGGEIVIESEPGQGAAFVITLPVLEMISASELGRQVEAELATV